MSKARKNSTRRSVLLGSASAAAAVAAPIGAVAASAATHPDAELIALCDRLAFVMAEAIRAGDAVTDESDEAYAEVVHPIWAERDRLLDAIEPLRAQTSDGIAARVRALAAANPVDDSGHHWFSFEGNGGVVSRQLSWLLRDTAALDTSGNIVWKPPASDTAEKITDPYVSPDAELIAACARFDEHELVLHRLSHGPNKVSDSEWDAAADALTGGRGCDNPELEGILAMRPQTLGGMKALARSAVIEAADIMRGEIAEPSSGYMALLSVLGVTLAGFDDVGEEFKAGRLA